MTQAAELVAAADLPDSNTVFGAIKCLHCDDWRADSIKSRIGGICLMAIAGQQPPRLTTEQLLRGCCQHIRSITYGR